MNTSTAPCSVCLVDDSAGYRFLVQTVLKRQLPHCQLHSFADGQSLLAALSYLAEMPSLILLDQHMPGWSGHQTLLALKQHSAYRVIPVVIMSTDATSSEVTSFWSINSQIAVSRIIVYFSLVGRVCETLVGS